MSRRSRGCVGPRRAAAGVRADLRCEQLERRLPPAGHTLSTASAVGLGPLDAATVSGFLASTNQVDLYQVRLGSGDQLTTAVTAQTAGSGFDPIVRVFNAGGQQVAADEQEGGDPGLTFQAATSGNYFVGVSSIGNSGYDPDVSTGATGGTSQGTYSLALSVQADQPLRANLAGSSFRLSETTAVWGDVIHLSFTIENRGGAPSDQFSVQVYVSPNGLIDPSSSLSLLTNPGLADPLTVPSLAPGAEWSPGGVALSLPSPATAEAAGFPPSGPVAIGIRIVPADPALDSGTFDKGGVHRGEDWEALTVVTPVAAPVPDLSTVDPGLNLRLNGTLSGGQTEYYQFTVGAGQGSGELSVRVSGTTNGLLPQAALYGGSDGQTLLAQSDATSDGPVAQLTPFITPGVYVLRVTGSTSGAFQITTTMTAALDPSRSVPTGAAPNALAVGDFDGSGRLDLAVANEGDSASAPTVQILLGNGDGTFRTGQTLADSGVPVSVVVADLNGDGKTDLAVTNADGTVGVFLGNGDGTFRSEVTYAVGAGPVGLAVAELTGNGVPDLVVANSGSDTLGVLLGNGDGTFRTMRTYAVGVDPTGVAVADLNGDGIPDIVATDEGNSTAAADVEILTGHGDGTFRAGPVLADNLGPTAVVVADLAGNGTSDIVVADTGATSTASGPAVGVFRNLGGGTFAPQTTTPLDQAPSALAVADLNGDGALDVVVSSSGADTVGVLLNNGTGTLAPEASTNLSSNPAGVVVADLNGDGAPDIVAADRGTAAQPGSGVEVLPGNGDGSFRGPSVVPVGTDPVALAVADFNGDGQPDVAVADAAQNQVSIELGNGDGTFTPQTAVPVGARPMAVVAADLNNDGKPDLVVANFDSGTVGVLLGNGDGTFRPQETYQVGVGPCALAVADLTGNGIDDIVVANNGDDTIEILLGNGDGTFRVGQAFRVGHGTPTHEAGTAPGAGPISIATADVNGNGVPDIVASDDLDNSIDVFLGNGDGTFRVGDQIAAGTRPAGVQVADVNGDNKPDIVVANPNANTVGVLPGNGNGTFGVERIYGAGRTPVSVAVADLTGNGNLDIVATNSGDGTVSVLLSDGAGNFQNQRAFAVGSQPGPVAITDVNGDGNLDILVGNVGDNTLTALLGGGDGTFTAATPANSVTTTDTPYAADLNGDGIPDSVTLDGAGNVLYRQGLGKNQFDPPVTLNPTRPARDLALMHTATGWAVAAVDANPDPALSISGHPVYTVSLYSVSGTGRVTRTLAFSTPLDPARIAVGDLTGDGRDDIVVADPQNDTIQVAFEQPDGSFASPVTRTVGEAPSNVSLVDVNGDGLPDIVVENQVSGDVSVFLTEPNRTFGPEERLSASTSGSSLVTASVITTVAGDKFQTYYGAAGPATAALLSSPTGVAVDAAGDLFIADFENNVIREVKAGSGMGGEPVGGSPPSSGTIATVAGTGSAGYSGDGGPANEALLNNPTSIAVDAAGDLFINDSGNNVVREVKAGTGTITTVAGTGVAGYTGDGGPATAARLTFPEGIAVDSAGDIFITDTRASVVREVVAASGRGAGGEPVGGSSLEGAIIITVAGNGTDGYSGDGGPATAAQLNNPIGLAVDSAGNLYIADSLNRVVREVFAATGDIITIPPTENFGLYYPVGVTVDAAGDLFALDAGYGEVREVAATRDTITTVAGSGIPGFYGNGGPALGAGLVAPQGVTVDSSGNLYIADTGNNVVQEVSAATGLIFAVAGSDAPPAYNGTVGSPTSALFNTPNSVAVDAAGDLYIADTANNVVREVVGATGQIRTIAGNGVPGYSGDGGPATAAELDNPASVAVDAAGNVYIADTYNSAVREVVAATGDIITVAGNGIPGYFGDGGPAVDSQVAAPQGVAVDAAGDVFLADFRNNVVREIVAASGRGAGGEPVGGSSLEGAIIITVAGTGAPGYSGDGGPATAATMFEPQAVAVDAAGDLFIADSGNNVVREVKAGSGLIRTVAGTGTGGYTGDGGPATAAELSFPDGLAVDAAGNLYIADFLNYAIREVAAGTGVITTLAGTGRLGDTGDGGPADAARLSLPGDVAVDAAGNVYIADNYNNVVRKVAAARTVVASPAQPVGLAVGDFTGDGHADILTVDRGTHTITVLPGNGSGTFGDPETALTTSTGDGLAVNNGEPPAGSPLEPPPVNEDPGPVVAGDFNSADGLDATRKGTDDLAILMEDTGEVWIFTNNGDGTFRHTSSISVGAGATGLSLAPGSAPGLYDLLVGNRAGDILTLVGTGAGTFRMLALTGTRAPIQVTQVGTGPPVALVANQQANRVTIQAPAGSDQYAPVEDLTASGTTTQLAPGAVSWAVLDRGSPLPDAMVVASGSNQLLVYRTVSDAGGTPVFAPPVSYPTGTDPVGVTIADINGDGVPDMLIANQGSNDVSILFGSYVDGNWVGTPGPRLKSAGGPIAVNLLADPASPGGQDLAITNTEGTIDVLPGRGQGFFDDRSPRVLSLGAGATVAQAPTFVPGTDIGYAVTASGALVRFDLAHLVDSAAPAEPVTTVTPTGVMAAGALADGRVVEAVTGGGVQVITPDTGGVLDLVPLGGLPEAPSALAVLVGSDELEVLVTSEGSDSVFAFATPPGGPVEVLPFETHAEQTTVGSPLALVSTLLTELPSGASVPEGSGAGLGSAAFNPLLIGAATDSGPDTLARVAGLGDDEQVPTAGAEFAAAVFLESVRNVEGTGGDEAELPPPLAAGLQELVTGTADGLQRLIDAARAGSPADEPLAPAPGGEGLLEKLLRAVDELPDRAPEPHPAPKPAVPVPDETGSVNPPGGPAEGNGVVNRGSQIPVAAEVGDGRMGAGTEEEGFESAESGFTIEVGWASVPESEVVSTDDPVPPAADVSPLWLLAILPALVREDVTRSQGHRPKEPGEAAT